LICFLLRKLYEHFTVEKSNSRIQKIN